MGAGTGLYNLILQEEKKKKKKKLRSTLKLSNLLLVFRFLDLLYTVIKIIVITFFLIGEKKFFMHRRWKLSPGVKDSHLLKTPTHI